ncbi:hypothetical protein PZT57_25980 [Pseudomonas aeruginosa]|uniref:hypothetical protein n=1 Tax=Pseudomonas aeruginosa TaxID=287 RepID=UPI002B26A511|nr:hypothetical protein [Pseudomonas aeruginosa]MEA8592096.1 hypothetical protein [Pseudomonas aeruginosa]
MALPKQIQLVIASLCAGLLLSGCATEYQKAADSKLGEGETYQVFDHDQWLGASTPDGTNILICSGAFYRTLQLNNPSYSCFQRDDDGVDAGFWQLHSWFALSKPGFMVSGYELATDRKHLIVYLVPTGSAKDLVSSAYTGLSRGEAYSGFGPIESGAPRQLRVTATPQLLQLQPAVEDLR